MVGGKDTKEPDVLDPPLATSDEDDGYSGVSDVDGSGGSSRGDIRASTFTKGSKASRPNAISSKKKAVEGMGRSTRSSSVKTSGGYQGRRRGPAEEIEDDDLEDIPSRPPKRAQTSSEESSNLLGSQHTVPRQFSRPLSTSYRAARNNPSRKITARAPKKMNNKRIRTPSPAATSSGFKRPETYHLSLSPTPKKGPSGFKVTNDMILSEDSPDKRLEHDERTEDSLQQEFKRGGIVFHDSPHSQESPVEFTGESSRRSPPSSPLKMSHSLGHRQEIEGGESPESPLSSPLSVISDLDSSPLSPPVCPMCGARVNRALMDEYPARMGIHQQQTFCRDHKKREAQATWKSRGYPTIHWDGLESRFREHDNDLTRILKGREPSHYRDLFSEKVKSGRGRTLLKSEESITPGYYGIRGLRGMSEYLVERFSSLLRKKAVEDRLVSARGHTSYVQSVLVPELAVRLIAEDLEVSSEEARAVLEQSISVGELLNEEVADVVQGEDDRDDGETDVDDGYE